MKQLLLITWLLTHILSAEPILLGNEKVQVSVTPPIHDWVTVQHKPDWFFFSLKAGYKRDPSSFYTSIPMEMNIKILSGSLEESLALTRKQHLNQNRKLIEEIRENGNVLWLVGDMFTGERPGIHRAFLFLPRGNHLILIDASCTQAAKVPPSNLKTHNQLFSTLLDSLRIEGENVQTSKFWEHIRKR